MISNCKMFQTSKRAQKEAERLSELKTELQCTDVMVEQWIGEVKEWAESGKDKTAYSIVFSGL